MVWWNSKSVKEEKNDNNFHPIEILVQGSVTQKMLTKSQNMPVKNIFNVILPIMSYLFWAFKIPDDRFHFSHRIDTKPFSLDMSWMTKPLLKLNHGLRETKWNTDFLQRLWCQRITYWLGQPHVFSTDFTLLYSL